jgi:hypothetical protein
VPPPKRSATTRPPSKDSHVRVHLPLPLHPLRLGWALPPGLVRLRKASTLKEWVARLGLTLVFVALVWSFALDIMWPPSKLWIPVLLLIPASAVAAGKLWLRYFEEQAIQREIRDRTKRLDRPAPPQVVRAEERKPLPEVPDQGVWPPKGQGF